MLHSFLQDCKTRLINQLTAWEKPQSDAFLDPYHQCNSYGMPDGSPDYVFLYHNKRKSNIRAMTYRDIIAGYEMVDAWSAQYNGATHVPETSVNVNVRDQNQEEFLAATIWLHYNRAAPT